MTRVSHLGGMSDITYVMFNETQVVSPSLDMLNPNIQGSGA